MLAAASERYPRAGAFGMGMIGTAGSLSIYFLLPRLGKIYDSAVQAALATHATPDQANTIAATQSFQIVAALPAVLLLVFGAVYLTDRAKGGFKPEKI
jgi:hypothetical protein